MTVLRIKLPTMAEVAASRSRSRPKGLPPVLAREAKKQTKADKEKAFRDAIWRRDGGRSRATGQRLVKTGTLDWNLLGEVDHKINRSVAPDRIFDPKNALLLSKRENRMKKTPCPRAPEHYLLEVRGPDDAGLPQEFTFRNADGQITKQTKG